MGEVPLTLNQIQDMPMAASPVVIEKGPLLLGEMPEILERPTVKPRFVFIIDAIKSIKIAYLGKPLISLWSFIAYRILGFFKALSGVFKITFRLNKAPEKSIVVNRLGNLRTRETAEPLRKAAVVHSVSSPVRQKGRLTLAEMKNYESMLAPGTNGKELTEAFLAKRFFKGPWQGQIYMVVSSPLWAGAVEKFKEMGGVVESVEEVEDKQKLEVSKKDRSSIEHTPPLSLEEPLWLRSG